MPTSDLPSSDLPSSDLPSSDLPLSDLPSSGLPPASSASDLASDQPTSAESVDVGQVGYRHFPALLTAALVLCWIGLVVPLFLGPAAQEPYRDVELGALIVFLCGFFLVRPALRAPRSGRGAAGAVLMSVAGLVATLASSHDSSAPFALCVVAAIIGFALPRRVVWVILAIQTIVLIYGAAAAFMDPQWSISFAAMMFFAAMVVEVTVREFEGRLRLAATSAALASANRSLGEAHQQLSLEARNAERLRISRDLHDSVGHRLTALSLKLELAAHLAEGPLADHVVESRDLVRDTLAEVRAAVSRLRQPEVDLQTRLQALARSSGLAEVDVEVDADSNLETGVLAQVVYRVVQESLTNVARHARARHVQVQVQRQGPDLVVTVADDGVGATDLLPGNGLIGMRERVVQAGGDLTWAPSETAGLQIRAVIPVVE